MEEKSDIEKKTQNTHKNQGNHHIPTLTNSLKVGLHLIELPGDLAPVDQAWLDVVVELEDDEAVVQVAVQVVHKGTYAQAVHPVAVRCNHTEDKPLLLSFNCQETKPCTV